MRDFRDDIVYVAMSGIRFFILHASVSLIAISGLAQAPQQSSPPREQPLEGDSIRLDYVIPDSFYALQKIELDTLLTSVQHQYDPTRRQPVDLAHLGNLGSAHRHQYFDITRTKGIDIGMHQYDAYKVAFNAFRFYDAPTAVANLYYSQGLGQQDGFFKAEFGRNFAKGVKLSLDYLRINQEGQYSHQRGKHTGLGLGVWYSAPKGDYDGLFHYLSNSIVQEDNGGISDFSVYDSSFFLRTNIPVQLMTALTTHRERVFTVQNHFHLVNKRRQARAGLDLIHTGHFRTRFVQYAENNVPQDSSFYEDFITDVRGLRHFIDVRDIRNAFDIRFNYSTDSSKTLDQTLTIGVEHRYSEVNQEPEMNFFNELFLNARASVSISQWLRVWGNGYFSIWDRNGDYLLHAGIDTRLEKLGTLRASLELYKRQPTLVENALFVTQSPIWQNNFEGLQSSALHGSLLISALKLQTDASIYRLDNYVYYDSNRLPVQMSGSVNIFQIRFQRDFQFGNFGLNNTVALQSSDQEELALPDVILRHQLYYQNRIFKKRLRFRVGADFRMTNSYNGVTYFPLTGQFHLFPERGITSYPALDGFISIKVNTFRAFLKMENITAIFSDEIFEQILNYPQPEEYFRFGVSMQLFD